MERENIIEKVRALRNLAQNSAATVDEAAAAARAAELLIQKHSLAETELDAIRENAEPIMDDESPLTDWGQRQTVWQNILIHGLAKAYNCESIFKWDKQGHPGIYAIGRASDVALLRYQYAFFVLELTRLSHSLAPKGMTRGEGKTWHNSFYRGAVHAILTSLKTAKQEVRAQATSSALAIVDAHMQAIEAFKAQKYPHSKTVQFGGNIDPDAYAKGMEAGANLNPKPGLGPGVKGLLK
jgi:hypothetical protein